MSEKLIIIDGNSLINRAFYALPLLTNSKGQFTGAVFGFANILCKILEEQRPSHMVVAFDFARKTFRNEIYHEYKATRKSPPEELAVQFKLLREMLTQMKIKWLEKEGVEADDIIGTVALKTPFETQILTGDRDIFQLIDQTTNVIFTKKGISQIENVNIENLKNIYGCQPQQVADLKALMGDASDNIPGVNGIGPKTALLLIDKYKSLDGVYANINEISGALREKLEKGKELAYISKKLSTIKTDCEIDFNLDDCRVFFPFSLDVRNFFEDMEFLSLLKRQQLFTTVPQEINGKAELIEFKTEDDVKNFVFNAQKTKVFSFDLNGKIEFSYDKDKVFFIRREITLFGNSIDVELCLKLMSNLFSSKEINKVTFNLKTQLSILDEFNIKISGEVFDCALAEYLIWAGAKNENMFCDSAKMLTRSENDKELLKELGLIGLYNEIELPLSYVLFNMEKEGFKIDLKELDELLEKYSYEIKMLTNEIYKSVGVEFNINSPKQLAEILFNKLGLKSYISKKLSTNIEILNELSSQHPVIELIIRYRKLTKIKNTYLDSYKEITLRGGAIIHTIFNQTLTATGRLSSSEPNLQNIPIRDDEGRNLRKLFISKFKNGYLVSADYNQIELRLLASFSKDENMIKNFLTGKDIHTSTASQIFNVSQNEVTSQMRRDAKAVNFGIVYGISDYGLATNIGISRKNAKEYIEKYFATYPKVKEYMDDNVAKAKQDGMIKTIFGRLRRIPEIVSPNYQLRQFGERVAMNMPLQGSASDIIKIAMVKVSNELLKRGLKSRLILQIHDELIIDTDENELEEVKIILKESMENVVNLSVPLPVEVSVGKTWFECK